MHSAHPRPGQYRRQLALFLAAILVPCLLLVALSMRMISQERELAEKRAADERQRLAIQAGQELLNLLETPVSLRITPQT